MSFYSTTTPSPCNATSFADGIPQPGKPTEVPHADPDGMPVLFASDTGNGVPMMCKTWSSGDDGPNCEPYDNAWLFRVNTLSVNTPARLENLLAGLKQHPKSCVIRGALLPHANPKKVRRTCQQQADGEKPNFEECQRRWILLDFDALRCEDFPDPKADPTACAVAVRESLPEGLRDVFCFFAFSSSTGMKPGKLGVHLWMLLETALGNRDAGAFIAACGADKAMSRPVQVHYTASPAFVAPLTDPLPKRFGTLPGKDRVSEDTCNTLVTQGYCMTPQRKTAVRQPRVKSECLHPAAEGKFGCGERNDHLFKLGGFLRSHGLDSELLTAILQEENAQHCDPPLSESEVCAIAGSVVRYAVDPERADRDLRSKAIAVVAGMIRHDAHHIAMDLAADAIWEANVYLADELIGFQPWKLGVAENVPALISLGGVK